VEIYANEQLSMPGQALFCKRGYMGDQQMWFVLYFGRWQAGMTNLNESVINDEKCYACGAQLVGRRSRAALFEAAWRVLSPPWSVR